MTDYDIDTNQFDGTDYRDETVLRELYHEKGLSLKDTAEILDTSKYMVRKWMQKHGIDRRQSWEHLKQNFAGYTHDEDGYAYWYSNHQGKQNNMRVHRLLAVAEYGFQAVAGMHVHHKNGIPWDNRPENIEVMDATEHYKHHSVGDKNNNATLTENDVKEIKSRLDKQEATQSELAQEYGVQKSAINKINTGRKWSHVEI